MQVFLACGAGIVGFGKSPAWDGKHDGNGLICWRAGFHKLVWPRSKASFKPSKPGSMMLAST
jgi:hypothetical protein